MWSLWLGVWVSSKFILYLYLHPAYISVKYMAPLDISPVKTKNQKSKYMNDDIKTDEKKLSPFISMLSHITETPTSLPSPTQVHFLYSTRLSSPSDPEPDLEPTSTITTPEDTATDKTAKALNQILFLPRLREIARSTTHSPTQRLLISLDLYLTNLHQHPDLSKALKDSAPSDVTIHDRRIQLEDLRAAVGDGRRTVCFVCGPPGMTDEVVEVLGGLVLKEDGKERVFCEKWW